ncbi:P-loop NTPase fold protein [Micromonospora echinaurantiaca]|uniref:P-loop NTPase fold protein n=1 Tax=Micromonospora echinaurantiaca TaxID=47857 RepID=UPI0012FE69DF|nr:P-loop NTPase fold protein [Micromonospora echinaurantiaca]
MVRGEDLIPDSRLGEDYTDLLEHEAIAKSVAEIALKAHAPVNIALFGPWGSGKSSVYSMIERHLRVVAGKRVRMARYDAWKYGGQELKRNFIDSISDDLGLGKEEEFDDGLYQEQTQAHLSILKWVKENWGSLLAGIGLAAVVAALWVVVQALAAMAFTDQGFNASATALLPQAGTVFGLALVAVLVGPKAFEGAVITRKKPAPVGADQFAKRFQSLVKMVRSGKTERLVVFIDELDRCAPEDVVATLIDLKTFLDQDGCAFIVAADREVLERALRKLPQAKPVREDEPYYATPGAFLDKIFQHQIALPPLRSRALTKFARDLADSRGGVWEELRARSQHTYELAIFALVPVHVRSPRRVKVLLNNYATTVRIAEARDISWLERAHELAVLTVLQTEFPVVAEELRRAPRLLRYLRGDEEAQTIEAREAVRRFSIEAESAKSDPDKAEEAPAGELLVDVGDAHSGHVEQANATLRRHLATYLAKVAAARINDPRPDLLYLQGAAGRETLGDPRLGDVIDFATDTAPDQVVAQFEGQESTTLAIAIPLLVTEGDTATGPGRKFAYEAACKLIEHLDPEHREVVARDAGPSLVAAAKANALSHESLPGALLVACWSDASELVEDILNDLRHEPDLESLFNRFAQLLPLLDDESSLAMIEILAERFDDLPHPLLTALSKAPIKNAEELWHRVRDSVLETLNDLETPEPTPVQPGRPRPTQESTGKGIERLEELIAIATSRSDGERLLSEIFTSAQSVKACGPLRNWALDNADSHIAPMASPVLRARHALLGLHDYPTTNWDAWSPLLPDIPADEDASVSALAADVLTSKILPSIATSNDVAFLRELPALARQVYKLSAIDAANLAEALAITLSAVGWDGADNDDEEATLLWARKDALFNTAVTFLSSGAEARLAEPLVEDLALVPHSLGLTSSVTTNWLKLCEKLPPDSAKSLSDRLDDYELSQGEEAAVLRLKLGVRAVFGGDAPPVDEVARVPAAERATTLLDAWLGLGPTPDEVRSLIGQVTMTAPALGRYCSRLSTDERTRIWVALAEANSTTGLLKAVGQAGVGAAAVEYTRAALKDKTRETERTERVDLLIETRPSADPGVENQVKKAASELAQDLLARNVAGDLRSAARVVVWARGAGYGHVLTLRGKFTEGVSQHNKALSKSLASDLADLGLLAAPKKGALAKLLGR